MEGKNIICQYTAKPRLSGPRLSEFSIIRIALNEEIKGKHVVLSLKDKLDIISALKRGESGRYLSNKYGVGTSTISDIKKHSDKITQFTVFRLSGFFVIRTTFGPDQSG